MAAYKGEKIPLFRSVLAILKPGRKFYVEVKENDPRVLPVMRRELERSGVALENIVMISFHRDIVRESRRVMPEVKTLWLTSFSEENGGVSPTPEETIAFLKEAKADGIDAHALEKAFDAAYIKALKDAGFYVAVWTVDDAGAAERYAAMGVDSITSNCAAKLRALLKGH